MSIKNRFVIFLIIFLLMNLFTQAQEQDLPFPIYQFSLDNGLRVILSEDNSFPLVSVVVAYNVGSINEEQGKTGLAYLMENLMFQGSKHVGRMQHVNHINKIGGKLNAETTEEKTVFYQTVPANQLALILWLESDRMNSLEINESKLERVKSSLIEEIHQRKASDPYSESRFAFNQFVLSNYAYSHSVIGTENDLRNLTVEDVEKFYSTFYTPNNAVLCIVGKFDRSNAETLIKKYFVSIPKCDEILPSTKPEEFKKKSITTNFIEPLISIPGFYLGHKLPSPRLDEFYPLVILEFILLHGKSSRLYKRLFKRERIAFSFTGRIYKWKNFAAFQLFVYGNNNVMVDMSKRAVFAEIKKIRTIRLTEKELTKAKNMFKADYLKQYSTTLNKALLLTNSFLSVGSLNHLSSELDKYLDVTAGEIIGVANKYFTPQNRIILTVGKK